MLPIITSLFSLRLHNWMDKKKCQTLKKEVKSTQNSQAGAALKSLGEKSWEIKGGGQEWLPPLISQLFYTGFLRPHHFFTAWLFFE